MIDAKFAASLLLLSLLAVAGCGRGSVRAPQTTMAPFTVTEKDGSAAIAFDKWVLVFEDVPAQGVSVGAGGGVNYPAPGGSGGSDTSFGNLKVKQSWNSQANTITVNGHTFKLTDAGNKLEFADRSYEAKGTPTTIVIGKDDKTREQTGR
jgi:hypothetical protein